MGRLAIVVVYIVGVILMYRYGYHVGIKTRFYPDENYPKLGGIFLGGLFAGLFTIATVAIVKVLWWLGWYPD